jgi:Fic family protein
LLYILDAVEKTALQTSTLVRDMKSLMLRHKQRIRTELPKIYSQDLINNLFQHPYTKIDFLVKELGITRKTAAKYLEELCRVDLLTKHKLGKDNYYLNNDLFNLLSNVSSLRVEDEEMVPIRTLKG